MNREMINIVCDTHWLSHTVISVNDEVVAEVIEIRSGELKPQSMQYLAAAGERLASEGFHFGSAPSLAEAWIRFEFRKVKH